MEQAAIVKTDDDALAARASAVKLKYLEDAYIKYFVKSVHRKAPIINRGTYVRTRAIDQVVDHFLGEDFAETGGRQIISLGAGSDTRFFRLATHALEKHGSIPFRYHEIDFSDVCQRKAMTMTMKPGLRDILNRQADAPTVDARRGSIYSQAYNLHPLDLADMPEPGTMLTNMRADLPTLVISEVCLIYLDPAAAERVLTWTRGFPAAALVIYEPIQGTDAFGRMMIRNLAARGLQLKTLERYDTLAKQRSRLLDAGFSHAQSCTMNDVYENWIPASERERLAALEMLDEVEEWIMLAEHYCVALGWRGNCLDHFAETFS
ncbi:Leucine carboxyl methyltransferase [Taphrina deformans PYCC 5710]|uniref:Leucine carboxyl methyltransferase 1 n=1 Tax=Taphrina deformans (strain PYCC 5710 / ATCC 11124 / CBS 356.35 / IMI 108563 / JCM 9778 / NBRC 8474) TaxID=1097556 RepID=R4XAR2_TAPDE|nr:Leucine carboxyl methyltransferase [Taphrina deformans PYCC 5710]|eukprot:CCG82944.1 Leucine carboxyl methyltransferase [Taphrina deformans PYCC 5710]